MDNMQDMYNAIHSEDTSKLPEKLNEEKSEIKAEKPISETIMYKRKDVEDGVITDNNDIEYYKQIQKLDAIYNGLLGDYNADGDYMLADTIIMELLKMPKQPSNDVYSKMIFLNSLSEFGADLKHINFSVEILPNAETKKISSKLYLIEEVVEVEGYFKNTPNYLIATYTDKNDNSYLDKMFEVFHIIKPGVVVKDNVEEYKNCLIRFNYLKAMKTVLDHNIEGEEEKLFKGKMSVLKKNPAGKLILDEYTKIESKIKPRTNRIKNRLLRSIEERLFNSKNPEAVALKKQMMVFEALYSSGVSIQRKNAENAILSKNPENARTVQSQQAYVYSTGVFAKSEAVKSASSAQGMANVESKKAPIVEVKESKKEEVVQKKETKKFKEKGVFGPREDNFKYADKDLSK